MTDTDTTARTSLQAFLFTDIVGSTDLKRKLGDVEGSRVVAQHDERFRACVARYGGTEQNNPGDGFFATFPVPSAALKCALAFQAELAGLPVQARVGIHMGESVHVPGTGERDKLLGLAVDTAGRVMSLALPGQILITRHAFDSVRQQVLEAPAGARVVWRAHGPYHLKGIDEPVEIHEAGVKGAAPLTPPPDSDKARRALAPGDEETLGWRPGVGLNIPGRDGWRLEEELGSGGFGEVWLAVSERTKERRAFKFCFQADRLRTLKRELTLFRLLKETLGEREDIARLYDVRLDEAPFFLEMEYTPDGSFDRWAEDGERLQALSLEERATFVAEVAEALAAAHSVGVLHKDVKPSNILVRKDRAGRPHARLTDFGIGQLLDSGVLEQALVSGTGFTETGALTDLGSRTGTRLYMAPELFVGRPATIASDVFALGVLLYQVVVGDLRRPIAHGWERDVTDPLLREDIAACVAGDPKERPASCDLVAGRLRSLDARHRERAEQERRREAERRRARLLKVAAVVGPLLLLAAVAAVVVAGVLNQRRRETAAALEEAKRERDAKARALAEVLRLADAKKVRDLLDGMDDLWPVHPDRAPVMAEWLERADAVIANRPGHEEAIARIRERAEPYTGEQRGKDHAGKIARLEDLRKGLAETEPPDDETERKAWEERRAAVKQQVQELEAAIAERGSWSFASAEDDWRHQTLTDLLVGLDRLAAVRERVEQRHEAARTLRERSIRAHRAAWDATIAAIAKSPKYGRLELAPQLGLVPLGPDPDSGLHEFAVIDSGTIPHRDAETQELILTDDFAIVLVLIPGETFQMGAQKGDPEAPNFDPQAESNESPVHEVTLSPYFIAKHEGTQAQWARLTGETPSRFGPGYDLGGKKVTLRHPVEQVSWVECTRWLSCFNLALPTEAQWEHACRAGTDTPWWCGTERRALAKAANVADAFCEANGGPAFWKYEEWDDGFVATAPVGSFAPNALGLHDVHGNVLEWCRDTNKGYSSEPATDPVVGGAGNRVTRGGSWSSGADNARSANRISGNPSNRGNALGVRPARSVTSK